MYRVSVFYFGALMVFTLVLSLIPLFSLEIWLTRDENYCDLAKEDVADGVIGAEKCQLCEEEDGSVTVRTFEPRPRPYNTNPSQHPPPFTTHPPFTAPFTAP